jgi:hypothetical protein
MAGQPSPLLKTSLPQRVPTAPSQSARTKKKLIRRTDRDYSQWVRRIYQAAFLVLNVWLGGVFYFWVRGLETGASSADIAPPPGVEGWLAIAGLMNLKCFLLTGLVPSIHPAAMFLLVTFLAMSFLFRKAFCSWLCSVGTISEYLGLLGHKIDRSEFLPGLWPRRLPCSSLESLDTPRPLACANRMFLRPSIGNSCHTQVRPVIPCRGPGNLALAVRLTRVASSASMPGVHLEFAGNHARIAAICYLQASRS